ncbi:hypothetical protein U1Q18_033742 [Sarracenia purpurea var. burkii]
MKGSQPAVKGMEVIGLLSPVVELINHAERLTGIIAGLKRQIFWHDDSSLGLGESVAGDNAKAGCPRLIVGGDLSWKSRSGFLPSEWVICCLALHSIELGVAAQYTGLRWLAQRVALLGTKGLRCLVPRTCVARHQGLPCLAYKGFVYLTRSMLVGRLKGVLYPYVTDLRHFSSFLLVG